jgi:hypothetical protein
VIKILYPIVFPFVENNVFHARYIKWGKVKSKMKNTELSIFYFTFFMLSLSVLMNLSLDKIIYVSGQEDGSIDSTISFSTYKNSKYGIELQYPSDWEKNETDIFPQDRETNIVTFISPFEDSKDPWQEFIDIYLDQVDYKANLAEYLEETITINKQNKDFDIISQDTSSTLSGLPAYKLEFTYTYEEEGLDDIKVKVLETGVILNNSKVYYIDFQAEEDQFDNYLPYINKAIDSFKIGKTTSDQETTVNPIQPILSDQQNTNNKTTPSHNFINYSNPEIGINFITYPEKYEIKDYSKEANFVMYNDTFVPLLEITSPPTSGLDSQLEYMQIAVIDSSDAVSIDDAKAFIDGVVSSLRTNSSFELVEAPTSDLIDGSASIKATYKRIDDVSRLPIQLTAFAIPVNDKLYYVFYVTDPKQYDKYLPIFDTILNSIDLAESKPESKNSEKIRQTSSGGISNASYIELSLDEWKSDDIDVIILVNQETENQSSRYVNTVTEAVQKWSNLLKRYSNNSNAWNFNISTQVGDLETVQSSNPNTIILELVSTPLDYNYCDEMLGFTTPHPSAATKPVAATILTSCSDGFQIMDLPLDDVYSTALHEFAHTLGLGHAFNMDNDLMCSFDIYPNGEVKETCGVYESSGRIEPSEDDVRGLLYKYGNDGFSDPNRDLFNEGGGLRPVYKVDGPSSNHSLVSVPLGISAVNNTSNNGNLETKALGDGNMSINSSLWKSYVDTRFDFEFKYPEDWTVHEFTLPAKSGYNTALHLCPTKEYSNSFPGGCIASDNMTIVGVNRGVSDTLTIFVDDELRQLQSDFDNFSVVDRRNATFMGYPAIQVSYTAENSFRGEFMHTVIWAKVGINVYSVDLNSPPRDNPDYPLTVKRIVNSFKISS